MIKIIHNGKTQKPVYRFHCDRCCCIWETDELQTEFFRNEMYACSDCPCCGNMRVTSQEKVCSTKEKGVI